MKWCPNHGKNYALAWHFEVASRKIDTVLEAFEEGRISAFVTLDKSGVLRLYMRHAPRHGHA